MSSDDEDFVFYGTPIEREEEITTRKKKAIAEASGQLRTALPPWKQEVTDEEGRRRFHGAFTGGFSAGYYNTVGSKEGWTPQSFTSSRKNRAELKKQSIYSFLDEDEKAELEGRSLETSMQFDTFGFTAAELARKQAEKEQQQRPSTIPGPVPDELIVPATESIGVKLLLKMGWRQGRSIKDLNRNSLYDARREARKAFLALSGNMSSLIDDSKLEEEDTDNDQDLPIGNANRFSKSTPACVLNPKQDLYGLGYDPFKHAPEFREKKRLRMSGDKEMKPYRSLSIKGKIGPGFGIGALEDLDAEDEDVYALGYDFQDTYVQEIEEPSRVNVDTLRILDKRKTVFCLVLKLQQILKANWRDWVRRQFILRQQKVEKEKPIFSSNWLGEQFPSHPLSLGENPLSALSFLLKLVGILRGYPSGICRQANSFPDFSGCKPRFDPPVIPKDFVPHHKFLAPLGDDGKNAEILPLREKNQSNPLFAFLSGGNGSDYYVRKLWEERQKRGEQTKLWEGKKPQNSEQLTAERRGKILGEKALEKSSRDSASLVESAASVNIQFKLSDTFTTPASINDQPDIRKPFLDDPEKLKRFEQFLKEKYEGGLRTKDSGGSSNMSEAARARERLEFEAAAVAIEKGNSGKESKATSQLLADLTGAAGLQFISSGIEKDKVQQDEELIMKAMYPKREEFQWRPAPILCKRFDLIDPYMGKPPPAPRARSKMDSLIFMPDSIKTANVEEHIRTEHPSSLVPQVHNGKQGGETTDKEVVSEVEVENVERPVDLYKVLLLLLGLPINFVLLQAIFSDDSDDEEENTTSDQVEDTQKKIEVANTTLNRLIAGDFLESLGKELGLMVPPETPVSEIKAGGRGPQKEAVNVDKGNGDPLPSEKKRSDSQYIVGSSTDGERSEKKPDNLHKSADVFLNTVTHIDGGQTTDRGSVDTSKESRFPKAPGEERDLNTHRILNHSQSSSSSEDERSRKRSSRHRHKHRKSSTADSDASSDSDDYRDRHRSKSRRKEKGSSREKSSSRRHSKHHKHRRNDSPSRSHRSSGKDHENRKRKKSKYED
ncbi:UNVERIFIED_CONTAM: G patch domain-containing protein TGH [Sesamum radiatum]|uniref:G patch domain-containing protein TGH n=1 Tax=Sesamum radiatum TaxID=300843 RepID=A0AAW2UE49_SESRA